ncbi:MAG: IclR family transcriptional regulator [Rhizobiaceae bacterium]
MVISERTPTNLRTLLIMEVIALAEEPLSPTQIGERLSLPKQSLHRLCNGLVEDGFLVRAQDGKGLMPAKRTRAIASGILQASHYHIARRQILIDVARQVGETVNFVMPEAEGMSYVDRVDTDWPFQVQLPIGTHVPFHCTASGKTFLACQSKRMRERLVASLALEKITPNTISDPKELLAELGKIAKQGHAIDNEEFMTGMVAIAVPVRDAKGRFSAALAFHGPTPRLTIESALSKKTILEEAAEKLEMALFG